MFKKNLYLEFYENTYIRIIYYKTDSEIVLPKSAMVNNKKIVNTDTE